MIRSREKIIIEFWTNWCEANVRLDNYLNKISKNYKDLVFYRVNLDENKDCIKKFNVNSLPTIIYFKDSTEINRMVGLLDRQSLVKFLDEAQKD